MSKPSEIQAFFAVLRDEEMLVECENCDGSGEDDDGFHCVDCFGDGEVDLRDALHPADGWTLRSLMASEAVSHV